jgi:predicted ATPase
MRQDCPYACNLEDNLTMCAMAPREALCDDNGNDGHRNASMIAARRHAFTAVTAGSSPAAAALAPAVATPTHDLPSRLEHLIGRIETIGELMAQVWRHRFVTIIGAAGLGKTAVALALVDVLSADFPDGTCFVDLSLVREHDSVVRVIATALGLEPGPELSVWDLLAAIGDKRMMIVLDSCEHVIDVVATGAIQLLRHAPGIQILATSREPLRAEGERLYRLHRLEGPPPSPSLTAIQARTFPAIELFVERLGTDSNSFELTDINAAMLAEICLRLDGVPLAIELAASCAAAMGVQEVAARLNGRLDLLSLGRCEAPSRHQTYRTALEWSYELLPAPERAILRRLAMFNEEFDCADAFPVAGLSETAVPDFQESVAQLAAQSLIEVRFDGASPRYRLTHAVQAFAKEKLQESGELEAVERRYAERCSRAAVPRTVEPEEWAPS